jgi:hypothetical protein
MLRTIRRFMSFEAAAFLAASLVHGGVLIDGFEHRQAATAEMVIGIVLLVGLAITSIRPAWTRRVGVGGQGFALLGTFVGMAMIAIGVGPRTIPDVVFHAGLVVLLVSGLIVAVRAKVVGPGAP